MHDLNHVNSRNHFTVMVLIIVRQRTNSLRLRILYLLALQIAKNVFYQITNLRTEADEQKYYI